MKPSKRSTEMSVIFPIKKGTRLNLQYKVRAFLGEGRYGKVAKCVDTVTNREVAIKIIKDEAFVQKRALEEIEILKQLKTLDRDKCHLVRWDGSFLHQTLVCLRFELLDMSLLQYMQQRKFLPLAMAEVGPLVYQLNTALLHLEELKIIHADLKLENIMIVDHRKQPLQVKLIDFGIACLVSNAATGTFVQSLWYRAPEVLLGLPFTEQIDMWSLGLIAAELSLGHPVFPAANDFELMKFIVDTLGKPPDYQLDCGLYSTFFFLYEDIFSQTWRMKSPDEFPPLGDYEYKDTRGFHSLHDLEQKLYYRNKADVNKVQPFVDLVQNMIQVDNTGRIKPLQVLEHPFFSVQRQGDRSQNMNLRNLSVNSTEEPNVTQQLPSQTDSTEPLLMVVHGKTDVCGPENEYEKMEVTEAVQESSKKNLGINQNLLKRIKKSICSFWQDTLKKKVVCE